MKLSSKPKFLRTIRSFVRRSGRVTTAQKKAWDNYWVVYGVDPAKMVEESNWLTENTERLSAAINNLDERSKHILKSRWLNEKKITLKDLSNQYNISIERVRQIEESAISQLRETLVEA